MKIDRRQFVKGAAATTLVPPLAACGGNSRIPDDAVPQSEFDEDSTAEEVTAGLNLSGKVAVVTGCTSGIGFETMRVLALRGAHVVGTSRSLERAADACRSVIGQASPVALELSEPESVVACADHIRSIQAPIDMLILNAGYLGGRGDRELVNGVEKHFAINHLGHFLLVNRLIDRVYRAWQGRVVVVASRAAYTRAPDEGIRFDDLRFDNDYSWSSAYGLARLVKGTRITSNALHPGVIDTEIDRNLNRFMQIGFAVVSKFSGKDVAAGAATTCYVATSDLLGSTSGRYFEDCNAVTVGGHHHLTNDEMGDRLWMVSEELLADYIVEHERPDETSYRRQ